MSIRLRSKVFMQESINSILISIHESLYPARELIFIAGLLYLIATSFYYQRQRSVIMTEQTKIARNAILHSGLASFIASYGAALEFQDQYFLDHLIILLPICTLLVPSILMLFLWIGYYFVSGTKQNNK